MTVIKIIQAFFPVARTVQKVEKKSPKMSEQK